MTGHFSADDLPLIDDFGAWLRHERERAGVSLDRIAAETKVSRSLLEALERNDVSRWPAGIFRRAFVRSYAELVGLDPDRTVALFLAAFPETLPQAAQPGLKGAASRAAANATIRPEFSLRLTLAPEVLRWQEVMARLAAALTDFMAPITLALPSGLLGGLSAFWVVLAVVAVLYLTVGTLVLGTTPGLWMMQWMGAQPLGARRLMWPRRQEDRLQLGTDAHEDEIRAEAAHGERAWGA
ncbi:MAG TPA: helix-turn-helix transcriptional regulator [Vicinamibacterales bacterium]